MTDIPKMKVKDALERLSVCYGNLIEARLPLKTMPSVMLWGPPGIGKSQLVSQLAVDLGRKTGKRVDVTDVRLILFNPVDLRGIPTANADKTLAVWLKPKIFDMDGSEGVLNILFLDEISAAPQSVQAAAYQITLDRAIGEHKLPDNCLVIAAGNRVTDRSVAYKMPKALANRLMHIEIVPDFGSWKEWAIRSGVNDKVIGFLSFKQNYLCEEDMTADDLAYPTPRTWEMVSNILNNVNADMKFAYPLIAGLVGSGIASEFMAWTRIYADLPCIDGIFNGKETHVPKGGDQLYALTSSMIAKARSCQGDAGKVANSIEYALRMPPDFACVLLKGYQDIGEDFARSLLKIPAFVRWMNTRGKLLNGIV
ncbi:MAG: ATP-binding protein [Candidatus Coproplasma sp.]